MRTGDLGHLMIDNEMEVWLCVHKGECLGDIYSLAIKVSPLGDVSAPDYMVLTTLTDSRTLWRLAQTALRISRHLRLSGRARRPGRARSSPRLLALAVTRGYMSLVHFPGSFC